MEGSGLQMTRNMIETAIVASGLKVGKIDDDDCEYDLMYNTSDSRISVQVCEDGRAGPTLEFKGKFDIRYTNNPQKLVDILKEFQSTLAKQTK